MRIRLWSAFLAKHPKAIQLAAVVSSRLPPALRSDQGGNKIPTPYKLFCEWLEINLEGDWSSTALKQGFVLGITNEADKITILKAYGPATHKGFRFNEKSIPVLRFFDGSYVELASKLGYKLFL
jgi:hypothetical protein